MVLNQTGPAVFGVPQGTVLDPLLFSLYISDIPATIESEIRHFADDCVCYRDVKEIKNTVKLQKDISRDKKSEKSLNYEGTGIL